MNPKFLKLCKKCKMHKKSADFPKKKRICKECRPKYKSAPYSPKRLEYEKKKRKEDPVYNLKKILRGRLASAIRNVKPGSAVKDLGCSVGELKLHLESQFLIGMNWENHGEWEIDHIIPLGLFDLSKREEFLKACNYTNLQPLWKKAHGAKTTKDIRDINLTKTSTYAHKSNSEATFMSVDRG